MYPDMHTSDYKLSTLRALLVVGFNPQSGGQIDNFPQFHPDYSVTCEHSSFLACRRLDEGAAHHDLPYAVLCDLEWLEADDYRLSRYMAAHPGLRAVPFVVFHHNRQAIHVASLGWKGVDDCYAVPVDWSVLENRLAFLNQYKPRELETSQKVKRENFGFRIPTEKRIFDIVGALIAIGLTAWIWIPVMLAIWIESKGPVIYRSRRVGSGYQVFDFFKFRSMYVGSDQQLQDIQHLNQYHNGHHNGKAVFHKITRDPRVTRVGRFIRKFSIDELPQLINVLRGEMSLVGNRPLPLYEAEHLTRDEWSARFLAPAGITGLWQVSKYRQTNMPAEERIQLDIAFAQSQANYSVWDDLAIALKTFRAFVQNEE